MSVEDEWDRELEADEALDLLFVEYDGSQVTVKKMLETIDEHGLKGELKVK